MKRFNLWLAKKSEPFSLLGDENFTNKEVVLAHIGIVILIAACCLAEWISNF